MAFSFQDAEHYFQNSIPASSLNASLKQQKCTIHGSVIWSFELNLKSYELADEACSKDFRMPCLDNYKLTLTAQIEFQNSFSVRLHCSPEHCSFPEEDYRSIKVGINSVKSKYPAQMIPFNPGCNYLTFRFKDKEVIIDEINERIHFTVICNIRIEDHKCLDATENKGRLELVEILSEDLKKLRRHWDFSDLCIIQRSSTYVVHKFLLSGRCSMLSWVIAAAKTDRIVVGDIAKPSDFLLYLYTGQIRSLEVIDMLNLYKNACRYSMLQLKVYCSVFIAMNLNTQVIFRVYRLSTLFADFHLKDKATQFVADNFGLVFTSKRWHEFRNASPRLSVELYREILNKQSGIYPRLQLPYLGQGGQNSANEGWPYEQENRNAESLGHRSGLHERQLHGPEERYENANWIFCHQDHGLEIHINDEQEVEHEGSESEEEL